MRLESLKNKEVDQSLNNTDGILMHFSPENLLLNNKVDWRKDNFTIEHSFRRLSGVEKVNNDYHDRRVCYTYDYEYYICFANGITEAFRHQRVEEQIYIKVENLIIAIANYIDANKAIHQKLYKTNSPYYLVISLIVDGKHITSTKKGYVTKEPIISCIKMEPFIMASLQNDIIVNVAEILHNSIKSHFEWVDLS